MERLLHVPLELALVPAGVPAIATLEPGRHLREQFHSHDSLESRSLFLGAREHVLLGAARRGGAVAPGRYLRRLDDRFGAGRAALRDRAAALEPLEASGPQARGLVVHAEGVRRHRRQALGGAFRQRHVHLAVALEVGARLLGLGSGIEGFPIGHGSSSAIPPFRTSGLGGSMPARCERSAPLVWRYSHTYMSLRRMLEEVRVSSLLPAHRRRRARPTKGRR